MGKYFNAARYASRYFNSPSKSTYGIKQRNQTVQEKIYDLENTLESSGVDVPEKVKRSPLDRILNAINFGNYVSMGALTNDMKYRNETFDEWASNSKLPREVLKAIDAISSVTGVVQNAAAPLSPLTAARNMISTREREAWQAAQEGIKEGLKGANPFGKAYTEGRMTADNWFDELGWKNNPDTVDVGRGILTFAADIITDPTTYITFGAGGLVRGTGKTVAGKTVDKAIKETGEATAEQLAKLSARELSQKTINETFEKLGTQGVIDKLAEKGVKISADDVPELIAKVKRDSKAFLNPTGQSSFGKTVDAALRDIGDKTIAPYVNTAIDKLAKSKPGRYFGKIADKIGDKFGGMSRMASKMAKEDPIGYAQLYEGGIKYVNNAFLAYNKLQSDFQTSVLEKFSDIPVELRKDMTNLIETPGTIKRIEKLVHSHDVTRLSDEAISLTKVYDKHKKELDDLIDSFSKVKTHTKELEALKLYKETMENISAVASNKYDDLLDATSSLKTVFNDKSELTAFLNDAKHDSIETLEKKLKDMGVSDPTMAAFETRAMLDKGLESFDARSKKYYVGRKTLKQPVSMDAGRPYTQTAMEGFDEISLDDATKSWVKKYEEYRNKVYAKVNDPSNYDSSIPIPTEKDVQEHFMKRYGDKMSQDDYLKVQMMFDDARKVDAYNIQLKKDEVRKRLDKRAKDDEIKKVRSDKINYILDQYDTTLPNTANSVVREDSRAKWQSVLSKMSDSDLEFRYQNALRYEKHLASKPVNKHDELAKSIAEHIARASRATQSRQNMRSYKDVYALMSGKSYDELLVIQKQLQNENKYFNFRDIDALVDSGKARNMADVIETERYNKNAKAYAGLDEDAIIADTYLDKRKITADTHPQVVDAYPELDGMLIEELTDEDIAKITSIEGTSPFTDASKSIDKNYFKNRSQVNKIDDAFDGSTAEYDVFNIDGMEVFAPVNERTDATVSAIIEGAQNLVKDSGNNKQLARLLSTMQIYLSDIDGAAEAITGNSKIIFGKNINNIADYDKYVSDVIMKHEVGHEFGQQLRGLLFRKGELADWAKAIRMDGNELFKGGSVFEKNKINFKLMHEDLAESFRMFLTNPKAFKIEYPHRYAKLQQGLLDLKVPSDKINKALDVSDVKVQQSAHLILENTRLNLEAQKQAHLNKIARSNMSLEDITNEAAKIEKLQRGNYLNKDFADVFNAMNPDKPLFTTEQKMEKLITGEIDVENEVVQRILANRTPDEQKKILDALNFYEDTMNKIYDREVAAGYLVPKYNEQGEDIRRILNYAPHQYRNSNLPPVEKVTPSGAYVKYNQFNEERLISDNILQHNQKVYEKYGIKDYAELMTSHNEGTISNETFDVIMGELWEDDVSELLMMRGLKSNQLLYTKEFVNHITENFGTVYKDISDVPTGAKLHASSEDIYNIIKSQVEIERFNDNLYNILVDDARFNGEPLTPELDKELREYATSIVVDEEKLTKIVEDLGLSKKYIEAFSGSKRFEEAFRKLQPITPISEKAFANLKNFDMRFTAFSAPDLLIAKLNKAGMMQLDNQKGMFLTVFDKAQRLWKINATSANIGFGMRNMTSNQFQQFLNMGVQVLNPVEQANAARMVAGKFDDNRRILVNGIEYTEREIIEKAKVLGVLDGGVVSHMTKEEGIVPYLSRLAQSNNKTGELKTKATDILRQLGETKDALKTLGTNNKTRGIKALKDIGRAVNPLDANNNIMYKAGGALNSFFENQSRLNLFLTNLRQGVGFEEAADNVTKFLFDYSDLSEFEEQVLKRIIPFYTWMRKNVPLQVEQLFNNPSAYATYTKVKNNIDRMTPESERLEASQKNQFAQDWIQLPFDTIAKDGSSQPTFFNPGLPLNDLDKLSVSDVGRNIFTSLTPFIKLPMEIIMNKNMYFDNDISKGIGDTDDAPGYLQRLLGGTKDEPAQMNPYVRYILKNIGSLENLSKVMMASGQTREGQPVSDKALALLKWIGGLSGYSYDVEKYTKWSDRDRLKELRDIARKYGLIE